MNNRDYRNYDEEKNRKFKGTFYVAISIITLIVAIIGASFSYFIASASSEEGVINAASTAFSLRYNDEYTNLFNTDLIPVATNVALYAAISQPYDTEAEAAYSKYINNQTAENKQLLKNIKCRDDRGNAVCSTYTFTITNPAEMGVDQTLNFKLVPAENTFGNLYIMVVAIDDPDNLNTANETATTKEEAGVVLDEYHLNQENMTDGAYELSDLTVTLESGESQTYEIIIYIKNLEDVVDDGFVTESGDQTEADSNKHFAASMVITPEGNNDNQIYGVIAASSDKFDE
jgi:hypothetical protein